MVNDKTLNISTYHMSVARLIGSKFSTSGAETIQHILLQFSLSRVFFSVFNQLVSDPCPFFFADLMLLTTSEWPSEQTALSEKISDMHRLSVKSETKPKTYNSYYYYCRVGSTYNLTKPGLQHKKNKKEKVATLEFLHGNNQRQLTIFVIWVCKYEIEDLVTVTLLYYLRHTRNTYSID